MPRTENKVDMAEMNAAIDKVLALPSITQAEMKERRAQRKVGHPPPVKADKNNAQSAVR